MAVLIVDYESKKKEIERLQRDISIIEEKIENDEESKNEMSFIKDVHELLEMYGISKNKMQELLLPEQNNLQKSASVRKRRKLKVFKNPHTQDVIETRGGNHKQLKEWRDKYGDEVEKWVIEEKD